jgi:CMP-N-acetylneuraminic acid synthetase
MYAPGWVRFLRPAGLATDDAPIDGALIHAVRYAEGERETTYDYIVLLPNSSVLRTADDIDSCIRILGDSDADSVLSVIEIDHPYELMSAVGSAIVQLPEYRGMYRRQDCSKLYLANGVVRAFRRDFLINSGSIWGGKTLPYIMPWSRSIDVQCEWDLQYASEMLSLRKCRHTDY